MPRSSLEPWSSEKWMLILNRKISYRDDGKMHFSADAKDNGTER